MTICDNVLFQYCCYNKQKKLHPVKLPSYFKKYMLLHNLTVFALFLSESV